MIVDRAEALQKIAAVESLLEEMADLPLIAGYEDVLNELNMELPPEMRAWQLTLEFLESTTADAMAAGDFDRVLESCRTTRSMIALLWQSQVTHGSRI